MNTEIENWFSYHRPSAEDQAKYEEIRSKAKELATVIADTCPPSADRTAAMRKLREAVMTANASIACGGK